MLRNALLLLFVAGCVPELTGTAVEPYVWEAQTNTWENNEPPAELVGDGFYVGEVPDDFRLLDQHGDTVSLWQFYGSVVIVDISTMWCAPCRALAETTEEVQNEYAKDGVVYVTILAENVENEPPSHEDLNSWADAYGIVSSPVVADPEGEWSSASVQNGNYPVLLVLDRELVVQERVNPPDDPALKAALDRVLGH
ncbi:MAG: TlpA family protein disulfide reductase [Proteobacteria bacterium]|nr:TlpA family protein disulfide reductase [Pseudomonadota bacterium]